MYKVMLIDDEKSIRSLLRNIIIREELGLQIAGEAESGIEAINTIDKIAPDIAFVDIKMPFMDGIEFSKLAMKRYPDLKIIILTAFNDFEYARQCMGIVSEYLLKPIVRSDIRAAIIKVIKDLDSRPTKIENEEVCVHKHYSINRIQQYIKDNYVKQDLDLTSIAQSFGFNASYLSRLFKNETGTNLIDYISECRMEKAIEYAKNGTLMYMTAKMVGIPDPNYFGKCFKKYTDQNYSEVLKMFKNI